MLRYIYQQQCNSFCHQTF